mmetsp:Transcript_7627/g.11460  ORF Transcript_7627/g.11460 Transcript_7627/m.11460 type:complete len:457 (-) Transcript_7627:119-1489(-)
MRGLCYIILLRRIEGILQSKLVDPRTQVVAHFLKGVPREVLMVQLPKLSGSCDDEELWLFTRINSNRYVHRKCNLRMRLCGVSTKSCVLRKKEFILSENTTTWLPLATRTGLFLIERGMNYTALSKSAWNSSRLLPVAQKIQLSGNPKELDPQFASIALKNETVFLYTQNKHLQVSVGSGGKLSYPLPKFSNYRTVTFRPGDEIIDSSFTIAHAAINTLPDSTLLGLFALNKKIDKDNSNHTLALAASCDGRVFSSLLPLLSHHSGRDLPVNGLVLAGKRIYFYIHHHHAEKNNSILVRYQLRPNLLVSYLNRTLIDLPGCEKLLASSKSSKIQHFKPIQQPPDGRQYRRDKKVRTLTRLHSIILRLILAIMIEIAIVGFCLYGFDEDARPLADNVDSSVISLNKKKKNHNNSEEENTPARELPPRENAIPFYRRFSRHNQLHYHPSPPPSIRPLP